jgi:hypothetical protein
MSIQNPLGGPEGPYDKYRKYRIEGAENEKHADEQRKKFEEEPPKKGLSFGSFFLFLVWKILNYFVHLTRGISEKEEKEIRDNLQLLKEAFESMKGEDRSQDIKFLNRLSEIWHRVLENSDQLKQTDPFSTAFHSFLKKIQKYPEDQEHTLGYYLTAYAGEKWLPFPYMELIQKIYEQHEKDPSTSPLVLWLQELDELLSSLSPDS